MSEEQSTIVTRPKHPGRVAAGHKLAALMKKRKEELSKEPSREQPAEPTSAQSEAPAGPVGDNLIYGGVAALVLAVGALFLWRAKQTLLPAGAPSGAAGDVLPVGPAPPPVAAPEDDIFRMN